jgi:hypothetical protein
MSKEKTISISIADGAEGPSIYINDHRVAGAKPWGGARTSKHLNTTLRDIVLAIPAVASALRALQSVEWVHLRTTDKVRVCPSCGWAEPDGHNPDCELKAALNQARGEE